MMGDLGARVFPRSMQASFAIQEAMDHIFEAKDKVYDGLYEEAMDHLWMAERTLNDNVLWPHPTRGHSRPEEIAQAQTLRKTVHDLADEMKASFRQKHALPLTTITELMAKTRAGDWTEHDPFSLTAPLWKLEGLGALGQQIRRMPEGILYPSVHSVREAANIIAHDLPTAVNERFEFLKQYLIYIEDMLRFAVDELFKITRHDGNPLFLPFITRYLGMLGGFISGVLTMTGGLPRAKADHIKLQGVALFNFVVAFSEFTEGVLLGLLGGEPMKKRMRPLDQTLIDKIDEELIKKPGMGLMRVPMPKKGPIYKSPYWPSRTVFPSFRRFPV